MAVSPGQGKPKVIFAVYGGLRDGNKIEVKFVTDDLQKEINKATGEVKVKIENDNLGGDPAPQVPKQFAAIVEVKGKARFFASQEGQTIVFK